MNNDMASTATNEMQILNVISALIDYPTEELYNASEEIKQIIKNNSLLNADDKAGLLGFVDGRKAMDLLDWQSDYDALFERGRSLSLLIFEHIHGESRDRGQAMIDLIAQYKEAGLDLNARELPDYIPLFLEFVSTQVTENNAVMNYDNVRSWLQDVSHIFALLKVRLAQRSCDYEALFTALVSLSGAEISFDDLAAQVKGEKRDDTKEAIDKVWEEEMVKFGPDSEQAADASACGSAINRPSQSQRRDQEVPISMMEKGQFIDAVIEETLAKDNANNAQSAGVN